MSTSDSMVSATVADSPASPCSTTRSRTSSVGASLSTMPATIRSSLAKWSKRRRTRRARCSIIAAATHSSSADHADPRGRLVTTLITPPRRRGVEYLDAPGVDPRLVRRSLADVALANALFGGTRAVLLELEGVLPELGPTATLLDVGSGVGDIAARAREMARQRGIDLSLITMDMAETLAVASRARTGNAVRGNATALPFANQS